MFLALMLLGVVVTLIYAALFGSPKTRAAPEGSNGATASSAPKGPSSGGASIGDAAYASSWTTHPSFSSMTGEDVANNEYKRPKWGSFRPGIYFGMKDSSTPSTDIPSSPVTGILWGTQNLRHRGLRHQTQQDELKSFDWIEHDGRGYGKERMIDSAFELAINASFIVPTEINSNYADNVIWAQRINVSPLNEVNLDKAIIQFYISSECTSSSPSQLKIAKKALNIEKIVTDVERKDGIQRLIAVGSSAQFGRFSLALSLTAGEEASLTYYGASAQDMSSGVDMLQSGYRHRHPRAREGKDVGVAATQDRSLYSTVGEGNHFTNFLPSAEEGGASFLVFNAEGALVHRNGKGFVLDAVLYSHEDEAEAEEICQWHHSSTGTPAQNDGGGDGDPVKLVSGGVLSTWLEAASKKFEDRFESIFQLSSKPLSVVNADGRHIHSDVAEFREKDVAAAKTALSSMLGGIGYFYGTPRIGNAVDVDSDIGSTSLKRSRDRDLEEELDPEDWDPVSLLTATPSRTSFPRGFLWDEGFHEMLISQWDDELSIIMISDWIRAMYAYKESSPEGDGDGEGEGDGDGDDRSESWGGWIPREMILGEEAMKRVPDEFITQRVNIANPPTLLLVLDRITRTYSNGEVEVDANKSERVKAQLRNLYPLLQLWVQWFLKSQKGGLLPGDEDTLNAAQGNSEAITGFRWRGRSLADVAGGKVLPNTLASGLDDYPRAPIPSDYERHVDLHCWMVMAVSLVESIGALLGKEGTPDHTRFARLHRELLPMLDSVHWFEGSFPKKASDSSADDFRTEEEDEDEDVGGDGEVGEDDEKKIKTTSAGGPASKRERRGMYADTGLQGVAGDEIITGVSIRCGQVRDRTTVETVAPIGAVVEMQKYLQMVKLQQSYTEKKKSDPALADEPPPVLPEAPPAVCPSSHPQYIQAIPNAQGQPQTREMYVVGGSSGNRDMSVQMIPRVGYVNIFPLLLKLLPVPGSPQSSTEARVKFDSVLDLIESPDLLWSPFGLRSIAKQDAFYQRRNSAGDAPYWRGPIWININYLALAALHHYVDEGRGLINAPSPKDKESQASLKRAETLYHELRRNIINTVLGEFHRTGFFWEQYDDRSGQGIMGHPFCGWTALVVNIMAELY